MTTLIEALASAHAMRQFSVVRIASPADLVGFRSTAGNCHENARAYAASHSGCSVVEGWFPHDVYGFVRHSIVHSPKGGMFCVTLSASITSIEFITHVDEWGHFDTLPNTVCEALSEHVLGIYSAHAVEPLKERR